MRTAFLQQGGYEREIAQRSLEQLDQYGIEIGSVFWIGYRNLVRDLAVSMRANGVILALWLALERLKLEPGDLPAPNREDSDSGGAAALADLLELVFKEPHPGTEDIHKRIKSLTTLPRAEYLSCVEHLSLMLRWQKVLSSPRAVEVKADA